MILGIPRGTATEINYLNAELSQSGTCRLTWKSEEGGVIICLSQGFEEWPAIDILTHLAPTQEEQLLRMGSLELPAGKPTMKFVYMQENLVAAKGASFEFPARGNWAPPLKIQLFSVSRNTKEVYPSVYMQNRRIIRATVTLKEEPGGFMKKGKKITVTVPNINRCAEGFMCYYVPGTVSDSDGNPLEYPIPNRFLNGPYNLALDCDFKIKVSRKWDDLLDLEAKN